MTLRSKWRSGDRFLVRHADRSLFVVEKRAGLLSQATESGREEDLLALLREFASSRGPAPVLPVHRLDRVVSGLLVYARGERAQDRLSRQFEAHDVQRVYVAAVTGVMEKDEGTFASLLYTEDPSLRVYSVDRPRPGAREAVTHYKVLERFPNSTIVEVELETGLRNQIRVHFAEAGHPLVGERKYQPDPQWRRPQESHRIFLHAAILGFAHPDDGRSMVFEAPLPHDLSKWKEALRRGNTTDPRSSPRAGPRSGPRSGARSGNKNRVRRARSR